MWLDENNIEIQQINEEKTSNSTASWKKCRQFMKEK